ncbi:MAG: pyridoxal phosphate-dependent decarboxylase family protein [Gemmataceae bacterium]
MEALLREPPPETGQGFLAALGEFQDRVAPYAMRIDHPRFLAFIPTAPTFVSVVGELLCAGTNFFGGVWLEAAGPSQVERLVVDWFKEWLGYPPQASGLLTSGGSEANLTALVVARERLSFDDRAKAILYVPDQRHWSVDRSAKVMGLRPDQIRTLTTDHTGRLDPLSLVQTCHKDRAEGRIPWAVAANAGATNTGAIDPLSEIVPICRSESLWLHADAAYGWPIVLVPGGKELLAGIGECDSITLDPHKWFGQTYDAGCLLVREGYRLAETFSLRPEYMRDVTPGGNEINYADMGMALTRRFRALKIWLSVKALGLGWFRSLVSHGCKLAQLSECLLRQLPNVEILTPAQLSVICFRFLPERLTGRAQVSEQEINEFNERIAERVRATGQAFLATTRLNERVAQRFCFTNWRTTSADVEQVIGLLLEAAKNP